MSRVTEALASGISIQTSCPVTRIEQHGSSGSSSSSSSPSDAGVHGSAGACSNGHANGNGHASNSSSLDAAALQGVTVHCQDGRRLRAQAVLVTVPIPILKVGPRGKEETLWKAMACGYQQRLCACLLSSTMPQLHKRPGFTPLNYRLRIPYLAWLNNPPLPPLPPLTRRRA